ncbi:MAG: tetratricopeptide repeat protein [Opitutaceae bacterium]|nr:tetratricopeptide repeat protein [Cytophagales bacterium]
MLKSFLYIALIFIGFKTLNAQNCPKVNEAIKAFQAKDLEGAKKGIESASSDITCSSEPSTWYYKAFIFKDYYRSKESNVKEAKSRVLAIEAAKKNLELDAKNKYAEECKKIIGFLSVSYYNDAAKDLNDQKYSSSFSNYIHYLDNLKISSPSKVDTSAIFYAGYSAYMAKNYKSAIQYLTNALQLKYKDPNLYFYLGKVYWLQGEKDKSYEVLNDGLKLFPDNKEILLTMVNFYIEDGKLKNLETALDKAIQLDPKNLDLKVSLAMICEKLMENDKSQEAKYLKKSEKLYIQVIRTDSNLFTPNYNLGILYYNKAVAIINATDFDADLPEVNKIQDECVIIFKQALPYMLRASKLKEKKEAYEALAGIYFALGDIEKSNYYKKLAESIK